ncbi:MAG: phosphotransferase [Burkholderiales bacterium]|nr:MAG: phosphotransferase [Burkholderiales bacterium]
MSGARPPALADPQLARFLREHGLVGADGSARFTPLAGGVSSDIWRVDLPDGRTICIKRALSKLKVAADWYAPLSRNAYEWAWIEFAARHAPDAAPRPLARDAGAGLFAMEYLAPEQHPVWKRQLLDGQVEPATAAAVGRVLAVLHLASSRDVAVERAFDSGANFHALRLEPYLLATARVHPALAPALEALVDRTAGTQLALVHGDVSPKNILVGPRGPVFLDAECAWYGDPAFDIAFCLNHLLLKCLVRPDRRQLLQRSFEAFVDAYFPLARFEPRPGLESRAASLLPGLLLARVDGKSPVEYMTDERQRELVRKVAAPMILRPPALLAEVLGRWHAALAAAG